MCKVTRSNFKKLRIQYGISTKEIADICRLSNATVNKFEHSSGKYTDTNARTYNADMMCQTLESLINRKEKEMIEQNNVTKKKPVNKFTDIPRPPFIENFLLYCNNYGIEDPNKFIESFGISRTQISKWYGEKNPFLSIKFVRVLIAKTGWTEKDIRSGEFVNKEANMSWIPASGQTEAIENPEFGARIYGDDISDKFVKFDASEHKNVSYTCTDGKFYEEYDICKHVKVEITKEAFLQHIAGASS